jgi:transcriptional regulator with XRE-family HTH domain
MPSRALEPLRIPAGFWQRPDVLAALDERDIGTVFRLLRQHAGASQTRIGIAVGMPQSQVSVIMSTGRKQRQVTSLDVLARIADGLDMPAAARRRLGLAAIEPPDGAVQVRSVLSDDSAASMDRVDDAGVESVRRRDLFELAGVAIVGATVSPADPRTRRLDAFADALTRYPSLGTRARKVRDLVSLSAAVAAAKRAYQACRYAVVAAGLPALLVALQDAVACADGDGRLQLQALSADAHHVAASVLLKLDDQGLASVGRRPQHAGGRAESKPARTWL